jgi:hypothetical protein
MNIDNVSNRLLVAKAGGDATDNPSPDLVTLLNQLRTGTIKIAQGDITSNRPTDPLLYEIYFDSTLGYFVYCSAPRNGSTPAVWTPLAPYYSPQKNYLVDGAPSVAQGSVGNLGSALTYGFFDSWKCGLIVGAAPSGLITSSVSGLGRNVTGLACTGVTATGAATLRFRTFIEAKNAADLRSAVASFRCLLSTGTPTPSWQITISKANAPDNFAAITQIAQSSLTPFAALATPTLANVAMGDPSNGICVDLDVSAPLFAGRTINVAEAMLVEGALPTIYPYEDFGAVLQRCQRYYQKSFGYTVAPAQNVGSVVGAASYHGVVAGANPFAAYVSFATPMRVAPAMTTFNPSGANNNWRNVTVGADSGVATIDANLGDRGTSINNAQVAGDTAVSTYYVHWTADARF